MGAGRVQINIAFEVNEESQCVTSILIWPSATLAASCSQAGLLHLNHFIALVHTSRSGNLYISRLSGTDHKPVHWIRHFSENSKLFSGGNKT